MKNNALEGEEKENHKQDKTQIITAGRKRRRRLSRVLCESWIWHSLVNYSALKWTFSET